MSLPAGIVEVGCDDGTDAPVALVHQAKEGIGLLGLEVEVTEFVNLC